jgi:hypothetical protein
MTLTERVAAYAATIPFPDSVPVVSPSGRWLSGVWLLGNNYRGSGYYGAYPPSYLRRIGALFPDVAPARWLHLFSGSLGVEVPGIRVDLRAPGDGVAPATCRADARLLPFRDGTFPLCVADPPYTRADAARYGTGSLHKPRVLREAARVVAPGGFLIWLDTTLPLYRKTEWCHWGMICVQRSTNHRTRLCSLFTRSEYSETEISMYTGSITDPPTRPTPQREPVDMPLYFDGC